MRTYFITLFLLSFANFISLSQTHKLNNSKWNYPVIETDTAIDTYFGQNVVDPYRNLENLDDTLVKAWYRKQKQFYESIINNIANRDSLKNELTEYKNQRSFWSEQPRPVGEKLFFSRYDFKKKVYSLNYKETIFDTIVELFSLDSMNKANSIKHRIDYFEPSNDANFLAFALSTRGKENSTIYVFDIKNKKLLPDVVEYAMGGNPQWLPNSKGFFYQEYKKTRLKNGEFLREKSVKIHYLFTDSNVDKEVFSKKVSHQLEIHDIDFPLIFLSHNSDKVVAALNHGTEQYSKLYIAPLKEILEKSPEKIKWKMLFKHEDLVTDYYLYKNYLYYLSYKDNPKGQVIRMNIKSTHKRRVLYEEKENVLSGMVLNLNSIFIKTLENGVNKLLRIELKNESICKLELPFDGSVYIKPAFEVTSFFQNSNMLFMKSFTWNIPQCVMFFNPDSTNITVSDLIPQNKKNSLNINIKQIHISSHDGTLVPLTIVHKSNIELNGQSPVMLEAYGCYGYIYSPNYVSARQTWLKRGGIYAIAHVRGGGEKGEAWYRAGYKDTKPNSWKDLISCSEYLIDNDYTSSEKLALVGTSAGGITIGRAMTERPELYKAAIISVGLNNVLRHEQMPSNSNVAEFGSIHDSIEFKNLYKMDVFHHIKEGVNYPSVLFTSGMNDPRLAPWQSGKLVAKLQSLKQKDNIFLYYISERGHSGFSNNINSYLFLLWQLKYPGFNLINKRND